MKFPCKHGQQSWCDTCCEEEIRFDLFIFALVCAVCAGIVARILGL